MSSKLAGGLAFAGILGIVGTGIVLLDGQPGPEVVTTEIKPVEAKAEPVDLAKRRLAVASWTCLQDAGIDAERLHEVCLWGRRRGDWIACLTDREAIHECERDPATIPDDYLKRFGTCRYRDESGAWVTQAGWAGLNDPVPAGWTCQVILPRGWWIDHLAGVEDALTQALREKCNWPGEQIAPGSWGACPHCLHWPEGCGPCRAIADKYGRGWPGHEAECGG